MKIKRWNNWEEVWSGVVICGNCSAFMHLYECPICHTKNTGIQTKQIVRGKEEILTSTFMGGIDYPTYSFLNLMRREWERDPYKKGSLSYQGNEVPEKLVIVLLFWSLFENLLDKFFIDALKDVKASIAKDLLKRYSSVGSRMDQLYTILFASSFMSDMKEAGYLHIYNHLKSVQEKRNRFMHGDPEAITDELVIGTVELLQECQIAWMALYNKRCTKIVI